MNKRWVALFSQTGSEIVSLIEHLDRWPDTIFTNNNNTETWHPKLVDHHKRSAENENTESRIVIVSNQQAKTCNFLHRTEKESLITLHGWLRIIPENICEQYDIVNGHPGLINVYPQLKGKDPQVRAYNENYNVIGSVVHKVTPEVDGGKILTYATSKRHPDDTLECIFAKLAYTSFKSWQQFFSKLK